jgi:hypothetical protein
MFPRPTRDNVQRFSLAGAADRPLREGSTAGIRAGERKTLYVIIRKIRTGTGKEIRGDVPLTSL